jgi:hypothetical protein
MSPTSGFDPQTIQSIPYRCTVYGISHELSMIVGKITVTSPYDINSLVSTGHTVSSMTCELISDVTNEPKSSKRRKIEKGTTEK